MKLHLESWCRAAWELWAAGQTGLVFESFTVEARACSCLWCFKRTSTFLVQITADYSAAQVTRQHSQRSRGEMPQLSGKSLWQSGTVDSIFSPAAIHLFIHVMAPPLGLNHEVGGNAVALQSWLNLLQPPKSVCTQSFVITYRPWMSS